MELSLIQIQSAKASPSWDFGNGVLYRLCEENPFHNDPAVVIGKVWLIGRAYAAAIERSRKNPIKFEDFYPDIVGPMIVDNSSPEGHIDSWTHGLSSARPVDNLSLPNILDIHAKVTNLFKQISGMEKRSLASKYLHFHFPNQFFIYDSRAVAGISKLSSLTGRASTGNSKHDYEYQRYAKKCLNLQSKILAKFGEHLNPRQIDNLLLNI